MQTLTKIETSLVDLVAWLAPLAAPIPTAYLVGRSTVLYLHWPSWVGFVAALIVESLGLATTSTALTLHQYNRAKRKTDPCAPFPLAAALVLVYFLVATGLTVALDIYAPLRTVAPAIFPTLSLVGVTTLAIRHDHKLRLSHIAEDKAERRAERQARRQVTVSNTVKFDRSLDTLDRAREARQSRVDTRLDALLTAYLDNPLLSISDAARLLNVSRQTVYSYLDQLEKSGRIRRNGHGVEVA